VLRRSPSEKKKKRKKIRVLTLFYLNGKWYRDETTEGTRQSLVTYSPAK
jgi:hypothetical protein